MRNILLLFFLVISTMCSVVAQKNNTLPGIGVVQNIENDILLQQQGYK
jgi:hypothetical protein